MRKKWKGGDGLLGIHIRFMVEGLRVVGKEQGIT